MDNICTMTTWVSIGVILSGLLDIVSGHGRLIDPPSRSSMFRYGFANPPNYNDHQLYCGGVQVQYEQNGGKCGVCGDPWQGPRENEAGGKYANGIIVRSYTIGQVINVTVELTVNHKGYFEFRLCPNDDPMKKVTHECLNQYVLQFADTGNRRLYIPQANGYQKLHMQLRLPGGVRCRDCLFQWKYNAGNSWGVDSQTGRGCIGCGNQEQFYGCSDIAIGYPEIEPGMSLITGKMANGGPIQPAPTPVYPSNTEYPQWESSRDPNTLPRQDAGDKNVMTYQSFQEFRDQFKDKNIQPCVCHTCVGRTCVCECYIVSSSNSILVSHLQQLCLLCLSVLVFLFSSKRFVS